MDIGAHHLLELQIACNPADTRRVMPRIGAEVDRVLDVGCGAGQTLIASALARHVTAVGIDRDFQALRLGRKLDPRIAFACCRGERLPLADASFDMVVSRVSLPYMDTRAALSEMVRVLRPGGALWLALRPLSHVAAELRVAIERRDAKAAIMNLYALANGALSHWLGREFAAPFCASRQSFQTPERMKARLAALGLESIHVRTEPFFVVSARKPQAGRDAR